MHAIKVDGQDVAAVHTAALDALEYVYADQQPEGA
jgi:TPP-dependent pyruvate/acetoin dehydrogenase alpha subunit